jgi:hypothetical protein
MITTLLACLSDDALIAIIEHGGPFTADAQRELDARHA